MLNILVIIAQFYMSVHLIIYIMLNPHFFITFLFRAHHVFLFPPFADGRETSLSSLNHLCRSVSKNLVVQVQEVVLPKMQIYGPRYWCGEGERCKGDCCAVKLHAKSL